MKTSISKVIAWFVVFTFLANGNYLYADSWVKHRSKCRWYRSKWKTRAWVDKVNDAPLDIYNSCNEYNKGCDVAVSECFWRPFERRTRAYAHGSDIPRRYMDADGNRRVDPNDPNSEILRAKLYQDAVVVTDCPGAITIRTVGDAYDCYGNGFAGFNRIKLPADQTTYHITKPFVNEPVQNGRASLVLPDQEPIYDEDNHTVIVKNLKGLLKLNAQDIANDFTAFTVSVTHEPQSYVESEDPYNEEQEYIKNLVWSSTAMLNNGRVLMNGALQASSFKVTQNDGPQSMVAVTVNIDELIIPIPESISLEDISVNFGIDIGNLGYGISKKFTISKPTDEIVINPFFVPEEVFTFENYPNAVSDVLNIKVELPASQDITISLLDINGQEVKQLYKGGIGANHEVLFQEDLSNLALKDGVYFLTMGLRNRLLTRKVIIKH